MYFMKSVNFTKIVNLCQNIIKTHRETIYVLPALIYNASIYYEGDPVVISENNGHSLSSKVQGIPYQ